MEPARAAPLADISEPFPVDYPSLLGSPDTLCAWSVPTEVLRSGENILELAVLSESPQTVEFLDLCQTG